MRKKCLTSSATFMQKTLTFKHIFSKKKKKRILKKKKHKASKVCVQMKTGRSLISQQAQSFLQEKQPRNVTSNVSYRIFFNMYCLV